MGKYTNEDVLDIVENEGLEYAILDYMTLDDIEDEELRELCKEAEGALGRVQKKLGAIYAELSKEND